MADFDSSLPIRTENDGDVVINVSDPSTPANKLAVEADGSVNVNATFPTGSKIGITDGTDDLEVNADGSINVVATATDLDIRDLVFATDKVDVTGSLVDVQATDLDIRDLAFATDKVDVSGSSVNILDENGDAFSQSNPLPVEFSENNTEAFDYHTASSVAANATTTQTYSAPAGFKLKEVYVSGSGKLRAQLSIDGNIVAVGFNSTANPQVVWTFQKGLNASSVDVTVLIANLDKQPQDLYSTVVGIS